MPNLRQPRRNLPSSWNVTPNVIDLTNDSDESTESPSRLVVRSRNYWVHDLKNNPNMDNPLVTIAYRSAPSKVTILGKWEYLVKVLKCFKDCYTKLGTEQAGDTWVFHFEIDRLPFNFEGSLAIEGFQGKSESGYHGIDWTLISSDRLIKKEFFETNSCVNYFK